MDYRLYPNMGCPNDKNSSTSYTGVCKVCGVPAYCCGSIVGCKCTADNKYNWTSDDFEYHRNFYKGGFLK